MTNAEKKADVKQFGTVFIMLGNDRASQDQLLAAMIRVLAQERSLSNRLRPDRQMQRNSRTRRAERRKET